MFTCIKKNVHPSCRLRIGGAADAANAAYGGVVVFKRNLDVSFREQPPQSSLSRSTFPSYPQAAGGVFQKNIHPTCSLADRRGVYCFKRSAFKTPLFTSKVNIHPHNSENENHFLQHIHIPFSILLQ